MPLTDLITASAARSPNDPALIFHGGAVSYAELEEWTRRVAAGLHDLGVRRWDQVALLLGNVPEFVYALHGVIRLGAVAVPVNTLLTPEEIGYVLADAEARAVIVEIDELPKVLAVRDRIASLDHVLVVGPPPTPSGTRSLDEVLDAAGDAPVVDIEDNDLALLAYSAGTTAEPKGAMLTHGNLLANLDQRRGVPALAGAAWDVALLPIPLFHIYAMNAGLNAMLREGAASVLVDRFDPAETLGLVERHRVTVLYGIPGMYRAWIQAGRERRFDLSSVRVALSGVGPLSGRVGGAFRAGFRREIWQEYGLTETAPVVTTTALGERAGADSIGRVLPGVELRLLDEDDTDVVEGDPGELIVRGPNVFRGYWNKPEETEAAFVDGWFRTGDIAYRDEGGALHLVDRSGDRIVVSGFHVFPREIEEVIAAHPAVAECAVVGVPDEQSGEAVKAIVVPRRPGVITAEELVDHCSALLARFKLPSEIEFVDELPRLATGRVLRRRFRS